MADFQSGIQPHCQASYRMQQNLQISYDISLQASNSQTKVSCLQCHITELNAQTHLSCLPVLLYAQLSEHARDRQSVLNYKPGRKHTRWSTGSVQGCWKFILSSKLGSLCSCHCRSKLIDLIPLASAYLRHGVYAESWRI